MCLSRTVIGIRTRNSFSDFLTNGLSLIIFDLKTVSYCGTLPDLDALRPGDELKIVVTSRADFDWARAIVERFHLDRRLPVVFSPAFGEVEPRDLVAWLLDSKLDARLGLQLHKVIWDPATRGV